MSIDLTQPNIVKYGKSPKGEQLYFDKITKTKFNPLSTKKKFTEEEKLNAVYGRLVEGSSMAGIARRLCVTRACICNWCKKYESQLISNQELGLTEDEKKSDMKRIEMDELYSFVKKKKTESLSGLQ